MDRVFSKGFLLLLIGLHKMRDKETNRKGKITFGFTYTLIQVQLIISF